MVSVMGGPFNSPRAMPIEALLLAMSVQESKDAQYFNVDTKEHGDPIEKVVIPIKSSAAYNVPGFRMQLWVEQAVPASAKRTP